MHYSLGPVRNHNDARTIISLYSCFLLHRCAGLSHIAYVSHQSRHDTKQLIGFYLKILNDDNKHTNVWAGEITARKKTYDVVDTLLGLLDTGTNSSVCAITLVTKHPTTSYRGLAVAGVPRLDSEQARGQVKTDGRCQVEPALE